MSIIQIYATTNTSDATAKEEFYEKLQTIDKILKHEIIILMGDFDARLSKDRNRYMKMYWDLLEAAVNETILMYASCIHNQSKIMNSYF